MRIKSVNEFMEGHGLLREFKDHTKQSEVIQAYLKRYLPEPLSAHCSVGRFEHGHLIIYLNNAAWSLALRHALHNGLLMQLKAHPELSHLMKISYHIAP